MKGKKVSLIAACMTGAMLFSGCGVTAPYDLTEEEENIIVNYAAHVVSKFNNYQGDGLTYVIEQEEETPMPEEVSSVEDTEAIESTESVADGTAAGGTADAPQVTVSDLNQIFGTEGLTISCTGNEIRASFGESDAYALDAAAGKTYLVLYFDIANNSETEIQLDNFSLVPIFTVEATDANGEKVRAASSKTILVNDFSTYDETVAAQSVNDAVLLFEVPDSVTAVDQIVLQVEINETTYAINL